MSVRNLQAVEGGTVEKWSMTIGLYLRYSSENQRDNFSLAMQREACRRAVADRFGRADAVEFCDEALLS